MQTIQQQYAGTISKQVSQFAQQHPGKDNADRKAYGSMAHKLPVLVRQAGLIQALAYVATRGKDTQKKLLDHLSETLGFPSQDDLLKQVREAPLREYMLFTRQTLWALEWYKRFAQSILGVEPAEEGD